ncbi:MAG TPA: hypothetical protein VNE16_00675 [Vicinamibacterales bacterium]|nr:hypothetical protein [Vicinamibacterales bacterium]
MVRHSNGSTVGKFALGLLALLFVPLATHAQTVRARQRYAKMAPITEYLMHRSAEIALARSAAPPAISRDATVLVLGRQGWETAVKGTNGFVCMVERGISSGIDFVEKWNPRIKGPDCLNAAAARTMLPIVFKLTDMALAGDSLRQRVAGIREAYAKRDIPPLAPGAMGYMMSKDAYLTDQGSHNISHLMFFVPDRKAADWGAGVLHSPISSSSYWFASDASNPLDKTLPPLRVFVVAVPVWSDGTPANWRDHG